MSQPAKVQEPSMEEILASIRRIIADDDTGKPAAAAQPGPAAPAPRPAAMPPRNPLPPSPLPPSPAPRAAAPEPRDSEAMFGAAGAPLGGAPPPTDDLLELTEQMVAAAEDETPSFQTIDGQADVFFADAPAPPEPPPLPRLAEQPLRPPPPPPPPQSAPQPAMPERTIMSSTTSAAVDSAFNALAQTVLVQNARTLEDLVREMLRPLLKSWLDDNLPGMVERIVKAEIERVSRGR
jgi:cell pole-organizing protein PopZ